MAAAFVYLFGVACAWRHPTLHYPPPPFAHLCGLSRLPCTWHRVTLPLLAIAHLFTCAASSARKHCAVIDVPRLLQLAFCPRISPLCTYQPRIVNVAGVDVQQHDDGVKAALFTAAAHLEGVK